MPKIHYTHFPVDGQVANFLPTYYGLVSDMANYLDIANKYVTSCCSGIWEMTRHNAFCPRQLVWTCYRFAAGKLVSSTVKKLATGKLTCYGLATGKLV